MPTNGHQKLLTDVKELRDYAVMMADRTLGVYSLDSPRPSVKQNPRSGFIPSAATPYRQTNITADPAKLVRPGQGLHPTPVISPGSYDPTLTEGSWAPYRPVPEPRPNPLEVAQPTTPVTGTASWGASGTPITAGFLIDLGEYNPQVYGQTAVLVFEQMRRSTGQVWATLRAPKQILWGAKWDVVPGIKQNQSKNGEYDRAKEAAEFVKENLFGGLEFETTLGSVSSQSWSDVLYNALLMLDFGCSCHEENWTVDGQYVRLRNLPGRQPITFYRWHTEGDGETLLALEQYGYRGWEFVNASLPMNKACRFTYNQEGSNYWGIAMSRPMYPHWYIVQGLYRVSAIAAERSGMGVPTITLAPGYSVQDRSTAFNFVTQLSTHEKTGLVLPPESTYKNEGVSGATFDTLKLIEHHLRQISTVGLQQFLTIGSAPHGSRATAQTQHDFFLKASEHLAEDISDTMTNQTVRRLVRINFGDKVPIPKIVAKDIHAEESSTIMTRLIDLANAGLVVSDLKLRNIIREWQDLPSETADGIVAARGAAIVPEGQTVTDLVTARGLAPLSGGKAQVDPQQAFQQPGTPQPQVEGTGKQMAEIHRSELFDEEKKADNAIYVARHGETDDDGTGENDKVSSWSDIELNKKGVKEAMKLARGLEGRGIAEIYASDLPRTMETAGIIGERLGLKVKPLIGLRSWKLMDFVGKPADEIKPDIDKGLDDPDKAPGPKSEKYSEFITRFADTIRSLATHQAELGKPILIVTHSWNLGALPTVLAGKHPEKVPKTEPGELIRLKRHGKGWRTARLQDELPSPYLIDGPEQVIPSAIPGAIQQTGGGPEQHAGPSPMPTGNATDRAITMQMSDKSKKKVVAPDHFDVDGTKDGVKAGALAVGKLLNGPMKTKLIKHLSQEALSQLKRGVPVAELRFTVPTFIHGKLRPALEEIFHGARVMARKEITKSTS